MVDTDQRRKDLAVIHMGAAALGLDDATYRDMLFAVARVRSAKDLNFEGRRAVIAHLRGCGFKAEPPKQPRLGRPRPAEDRLPMIKKIRALLAEAGRPDSYADKIAYSMARVKFFEWLPPDRLHSLVASLMIDRGRRRVREAREAERKGHNLTDRMEV